LGTREVEAWLIECEAQASAERATGRSREPTWASSLDGRPHRVMVAVSRPVRIPAKASCTMWTEFGAIRIVQVVLWVHHIAQRNVR